MLVLVSMACSLFSSSPQATQVVTPEEPIFFEMGSLVTEAPGMEETAAPAAPSEEVTTPHVTSTVEIPAGVHVPAFAEYPMIQVSLPESFPGGCSLPVDLALVQGMDTVTLSDAQKALLSQNGFVVAAPEPGKYREFYQVYESLRYGEQPVFVTTDAVFQV